MAASLPLARAPRRLGRYRREIAAGLAYALLLAVVAAVRPAFFTAVNARDLAMNNAAVLIAALGATLVILTGHIDVSIASQFAICSVAAGLLARAGLPGIALAVAALLVGASLGAANGWLVARLKIPAIVATLATFVAWRDGLRWLTEGAWVQGLPAEFQWFGLGQTAGQWVIAGLALLVFGGLFWVLENVGAGRQLYAVGSNAEAARFAGIEPAPVVLGVFTASGALVGLAALVNASRFGEVPANAGAGLELKAIAAVVVGGTAITGGRGSLLGTLIGVALLGTIGTALTFLGINPFWEKAIQGAVILAALAADLLLGRLNRHARRGAR